MEAVQAQALFPKWGDLLASRGIFLFLFANRNHGLPNLVHHPLKVATNTIKPDA
jgi:hypothetical protein